jgi:glycosyltransferase involved in cell wall biosynthesis
MVTNSADVLDVLHVLGGSNRLGGIMALVTKIASSPVPGIRQSIWKNREFPVPDGSEVNWVCAGSAPLTELSIPSDVIGAFRDVPGLRSWVQRHANAVLYGHGRMGMLAAAITARMAGSPLLIHVHARARRPGLYRWLWRWSRAKVVFNSRQTCRHYGYDPDESLIAMPPISWPSSEVLSDIRQSGSARFVSAGMFVPCKNLHILVGGFKLLVENQPDAELCLFGNSSEVISDYQQRVMASVQDHMAIHLMGWDPNWTASLRPADIFVHASQVEGFGIVILEAFARGCRLVVPPETFLDELPPPLDKLGIVRAKQMDAAGYRWAMQEALAIEPPQGGFWEARKEVSHLFSTETTNRRLGELYRLVSRERHSLKS